MEKGKQGLGEGETTNPERMSPGGGQDASAWLANALAQHKYIDMKFDGALSLWLSLVHLYQVTQTPEMTVLLSYPHLGCSDALL